MYRNFSPNYVFLSSLTVLLYYFIILFFFLLCRCSEYGKAWHKGGSLAKKQNVFDDFHAAAEFLVDNKYTNPKK